MNVMKNEQAFKSRRHIARKEHKMTAYRKLVRAEKTCHTIEVREKGTGKTGVANTFLKAVEVFYGADDGSDDTILSAREFNRRFEITAMLKNTHTWAMKLPA